LSHPHDVQARRRLLDDEAMDHWMSMPLLRGPTLESQAAAGSTSAAAASAREARKQCLIGLFFCAFVVGLLASNFAGTPAAFWGITVIGCSLSIYINYQAARYLTRGTARTVVGCVLALIPLVTLVLLAIEFSGRIKDLESRPQGTAALLQDRPESVAPPMA
jgi:hypothetical protein